MPEGIPAQSSEPSSANIVLVPGAYHGGWYYTPMADQLRNAGHRVYTISLTGLGEAVSRPLGAINLDTHIDDVVTLIELEQLQDVILCGHSYGGMVIAGVADRLAGRIKTLVFIDALVPQDGDSIWSLFKDFQRERFLEAATDGLFTPAPPDVDPRARAHPLATFLQPLRLSNNTYEVSRKVYVLCASNEGSPFFAIHAKLANEPEWEVHELPCGHDFMNDAPQLATDLMQAIVRG